MDLENFVASTLAQIARGIKKAQTDAADTGAWINPSGDVPGRPATAQLHIDLDERAYIQDVHFDVAVTISNEQAAGAEGKITVLGLRIGGDGKVTYENSSVSRVQFRVAVAWPGQRNAEYQRQRAEKDQADRAAMHAAARAY